MRNHVFRASRSRSEGQESSRPPAIGPGSAPSIYQKQGGEGMSTLFPRTIKAISTAPPKLVNGVWEFSETDGTFTGSVQPLTGKELQFLPEGRRDIGLMKVYSNTPLSVSVEGSNTPGDVGHLGRSKMGDYSGACLCKRPDKPLQVYCRVVQRRRRRTKKTTKKRRRAKMPNNNAPQAVTNAKTAAELWNALYRWATASTSKKSEGGKKPSGHGERQGNVYLYQLRRELEPRGLQCV